MRVSNGGTGTNDCHPFFRYRNVRAGNINCFIKSLKLAGSLLLSVPIIYKVKAKKQKLTSGQDGGVGRQLRFLVQPQRELQLNLKITLRTVRKSNCMEIQQPKI